MKTKFIFLTTVCEAEKHQQAKAKQTPLLHDSAYIFSASLHTLAICSKGLNAIPTGLESTQAQKRKVSARDSFCPNSDL